MIALSVFSALTRKARTTVSLLFQPAFLKQMIKVLSQTNQTVFLAKGRARGGRLLINCRKCCIKRKGRNENDNCKIQQIQDFFFLDSI